MGLIELAGLMGLIGLAGFMGVVGFRIHGGRFIEEGFGFAQGVGLLVFCVF